MSTEQDGPALEVPPEVLTKMAALLTDKAAKDPAALAHIKALAAQLLSSAAVTEEARTHPGAKDETLLETKERERLLAELREQHHHQTEAHRRTGLSDDQMPEWEQTSRLLTPRFLARIARMQEFDGQPFGLLIPAAGPLAQIDAMNRHKINAGKGMYQFHNVLVDWAGAEEKHLTEKARRSNKIDISNIHLWNGGQPWPKTRQWHYVVVDGRKNIPDDPTITGAPEEIVAAWLRKYQKHGFGVLTGISPYLALIRQSLVAGDVIDTARESLVTLNAVGRKPTPSAKKGALARLIKAAEFVNLKGPNKDHYIAAGHWNGNHVSLGSCNPQFTHSPYLKARAMLEPVKQ